MRADLSSESRRVGVLVRYVVLLSVCARGVWLMLMPDVRASILTWGAVIHDGRLLFITTAAATVTAATGMILFAPLPMLPYMRFWSRSSWFIRSWIFPLVSLNTLALSLVSTGLLGLRGVAYCGLFFVVHLLAQRVFASALISSVAAAALAYRQMGETTVALAIGLCVALGVLWSWKSARHGIADVAMQPRLGWSSLKASVRKELRYHRAFTSDMVHVILAFLMWGWVGQGLILGSLHHGKPLAVPFICMLGLLPFSRVLLNLLGMDAPALGRLLQRPERLVQYELSRLRAYALVVYMLDLIVAVRMVFGGDGSFVPQLAVTALAYTELTLLGGFLLSFYVFEEKEMAWRYGQHVNSKSVMFSTCTLFAIGGAIYLIGNLGGIIALACLAGTLLYVNRRWLPDLALAVVHRRRAHLLRVA